MQQEDTLHVFHSLDLALRSQARSRDSLGRYQKSEAPCRLLVVRRVKQNYKYQDKTKKTIQLGIEQSRYFKIPFCDLLNGRNFGTVLDLADLTKKAAKTHLNTSLAMCPVGAAPLASNSCKECYTVIDKKRSPQPRAMHMTRGMCLSCQTSVVYIYNNNAPMKYIVLINFFMKHIG